MDLTLEFIRLFVLGLVYAAPVLLVLIGVIIAIGLLVGRQEGWSGTDAIYYAFITATTVGYGDYHPGKNISKYLAIVIALTGLLMTGIVVSLALHAASIAFKDTHNIQQVTR